MAMQGHGGFDVWSFWCGVRCLRVSIGFLQRVVSKPVIYARDGVCIFLCSLSAVRSHLASIPFPRQLATIGNEKIWMVTVCQEVELPCLLDSVLVVW